MVVGAMQPLPSSMNGSYSTIRPYGPPASRSITIADGQSFRTVPRKCALPVPHAACFDSIRL